MVNKMSTNAKFSKKIKSKVKTNREAIFLKKKEKFLKMEGYRIEVAENSLILFEKEEDYLNILYLEKVLFDFINNLLFNKDKDKEIRIYLSLIEKYLKSLPKYRKIKIFYDESEYENPFKIKFPFICYLDDPLKREEYYDKIVELQRSYYKKLLEDEVAFYEGTCLVIKHNKVINLMYKRINIEYYKRKRNKFEYYNKIKCHHKICYPEGFMYDDSELYSDTDTDTDTYRYRLKSGLLLFS